MSLIIHTIVPEGIVVCADTRTTHRDGKGHVQYDDTAEKIVPFPNRIVVSHCGDAKVRENLTVMQFLYDIRKKYGKQTTIDDLPLKILNEYFRVNGNGCTILVGILNLGERLVLTLSTLPNHLLFYRQKWALMGPHITALLMLHMP